MSNTIITNDSIDVTIENSIDLIVPSDTEIEVQDSEFEVEVTKKEYTIIGDSIYASTSVGEAPDWLNAVIDTTISTRLSSSLSDLNTANNTISVAIDEIEVAKNQYQELVNIESTIDSAITSRLTTLNASIDQNRADIVALDATKVTSDQALAISADKVSAELNNGNIAAEILRLDTAIATETQARSTSETVLTATLISQDNIIQGNTQLILDLNATVDGIESKFAYDSLLEINGQFYYSGFGLTSTATVGSGTETNPFRSKFWINATEFEITNGTAGYSPFTIVGNDLVFNGKVTFNNVTDTENLVETSDLDGLLEASDLGPAGTTVIDGGRIQTGLVSANVIDSNIIRVTDLSGSGSSVINGDNITTGTINARRLLLDIDDTVTSADGNSKMKIVTDDFYALYIENGNTAGYGAYFKTTGSSGSGMQAETTGGSNSDAVVGYANGASSTAVSGIANQSSTIAFNATVNGTGATGLVIGTGFNDDQTAIEISLGESSDIAFESTTLGYDGYIRMLGDNRLDVSTDSSNPAIYGYSNDGVGVHGASNNWYGLRGNSNSGIGIRGITGNNYAGYFTTSTDNSSFYGIYSSTTSQTSGIGFYTPNRVYAGDGYEPFTGQHVGFSVDTQIVGDIVTVTGAKGITINQTYVLLEPTQTVRDKNVYGVVSSINNDIGEFLLSNEYVSDISINDETGKITKELKEEYLEYTTNLIDKEYKVVTCNSLGEGMINVCSLGGNIEAGDYICSSALKGKGMKQADDLLHNYTVAKALEDVNWDDIIADDEGNKVKMMACTYHCA